MAENSRPMSGGVTSLTNLIIRVSGCSPGDGEERTIYHGIDFGCSTTVSAIPTDSRYNANMRSAYNSKPALSRIISMRAPLNFEIEFHAAERSF